MEKLPLWIVWFYSLPSTQPFITFKVYTLLYISQYVVNTLLLERVHHATAMPVNMFPNTPDKENKMESPDNPTMGSRQ